MSIFINLLWFTLLLAVCYCFLLLFQCFSAGVSCASLSPALSLSLLLQTAGGSMDNWITGLWDNRAPSSPRARASIERALPLLSRVCVCVSLWPCPHPSSIIPAQPSNSSKGERRDTENVYYETDHSNQSRIYSETLSRGSNI